jgi:co-chaperonin GroES (HSP10)
MFVPFNRFLLVESVKTEDKEKSIVLLPESSVKTSPFSVVKLIDVSKDCNKYDMLYNHIGAEIVVHTNMIEEVSFGNKRYTLVLENNVVGLLNSRD